MREEMGFEGIEELDAFEDFAFHDEAKPYDIRHRTYYFAREIVKFIGREDYDRRYRSLYDQLLRSGTSIGANLAEGRAGSSKKDWRNYLAIALKSANETKYWLCLVRDTVSTDKKLVNELIQEANELSKIIASIIINSHADS